MGFHTRYIHSIVYHHLTVSEWTSLNYQPLKDALYRISGSPLHTDLLHETLTAFLTHKDAQTIVDSGGAFFYCLRIATNLWKSDTSPFYKQYKHEHVELTESHELIAEVPVNTEALYNEIDRLIDKDLSWYENRLLKLYAEEGANALRIAKLTGIPRTSISLTIKRIKTHIRTTIRYEDN